MFWKVMAIAGFFLLCLIFGALSRLSDSLDRVFKALGVAINGEESTMRGVVSLLNYAIKDKGKLNGMMPYKDPL